MRELIFDLSDDLYLPKGGFGGFEGEHNATRLTLRLPPRLLAPDAIYYMVFETEGNSEMIFSAPLLPDEDAICALLPKQVMLAPSVIVHAAAYRKNGEELVEIAKSARVVLEIKYPEGEVQSALSQEGGEIPGLVIESAVLPESENPVSSRALYGELSSLEGEQIQSALVNDAGELILQKKNRKTLSVGNVIGPQGPKGERGEKGDKGEKGDVDHTALAEVRRYKYDYDCNGVVDINDAIFLLYHIQNSEKYPIPSWCNGDFNGDGVVNEDDAEDMMYAVNAPSQHPHLYDTDARTADYSIVANALKGTVSGEAVSMKDVSPLEHSIVVELKSDTITDFSSVTLKKCGKNLLDLTSLIGKSVTTNGGTLSCGADGGISGSGTASGYVGFAAFRLYLPKGKYILSASGTFSNFGCYLTFRDKNNVNLGDGVANRPGGDFVFNTENYPSYSYVDVTIKRNNDTALSGTAYFQIELGSGKATEYEPFKEPETYNGAVKSVLSLYPTTTLLTDTEGVTITAEYNKDLNKAFEEIQQKLTALSAVLINNA